MNGISFFYGGMKTTIEVSRKYESKCCKGLLFFVDMAGKTDRRCIMICGDCTKETTGVEL